MKEYTIVPPKDEKDIRIQQLELELQNLKASVSDMVVSMRSTNPQPTEQHIEQPTEPIAETSQAIVPSNVIIPTEDYTIEQEKQKGFKLKFKK